MFALLIATGYFVWRAGAAVKHRFCGNQEREINESNVNRRGPFRDTPSRAGVVRKKKSLDSEATLVPESRRRAQA